MGTPPGWGFEHRASNPVSVKNLTAIEISKLLRPYVPGGTKRTRRRRTNISKRYYSPNFIVMSLVSTALPS
jgi:hypothetical protein